MKITVKQRILAALVALVFVIGASGCSAKGWSNAPMGHEWDGSIANRDGSLYPAPVIEWAVDEGMIMPGEVINDPEIIDSLDKYYGEWLKENMGKLIENKFVETAKEATSTFSADVDTASYTYFRKLVSSGYSLPDIISFSGADLRTEEMINYFKYGYSQPEDGELFGLDFEIADCPWNSEASLLVMRLSTEAKKVNSRNNLVFLIDVSGSMASSDKLELLKTAFGYLTDQLGEDDTVSIVTYSGKESVVLDGCSGAKKEKIMKAVNSLKASGSTNGEAGLAKAYKLAEKHFIDGGNNRIIMASDGDLNVGIASAEELKNYVTDMRTNGVYLSTLGFGSGNYRDANMEALADNGNGAYYYIDCAAEAERIFSSELFSTLYTVAGDVKLQLTFAPEAVCSYRLVGYENRVMNNEDFKDDTKDAGEIGAGHAVTVCYELILADGAETVDEWMKLSVRYKNPGESKANQNDYSIGKKDLTADPSDDFRFVSAVAKLSMLLHESEYLDDGVTLETIISELDGIGEYVNADEYKEAFRDMLDELRTRGEPSDYKKMKSAE